MSKKKFYDLRHIMSHKMNRPTTMKDWTMLRERLEVFISKQDENENKVYPLRNMFAYLTDTTDISDKMAITGVIFTLSSSTRKDQYIKIMQGSKNLNIWTLLIGQSSNARKTTTEKKIKRLLEGADVTLIPQNFTGPAIIDVLGRTPQGSLIKSEVSRLFKSFKREYNEELPESLSQIYDCDDVVEHVTRTRGHEIVRDPYVIIWGATTPFAYEHFTDELFMQGFLQRFLYCMELEKVKYDPLSFESDLSDIHQQYSSELLRAMRGTSIQTVRPYQTTQKWDQYQKYVKDIALSQYQDERSTVFPYWGRVSEFVLKIAGILEIARASYIGLEPIEPDNYIPLNPNTLDLAIDIVQLYEQEFLTLIQKVRYVAGSENIKTDRTVKNYINNIILGTDNGIISNPDLLEQSEFSRKKVIGIINTLIEEEALGTCYAPISQTRGSAPRLYYVFSDYEDEEEMKCVWVREIGKSDKWKCSKCSSCIDGMNEKLKSES